MRFFRLISALAGVVFLQQAAVAEPAIRLMVATEIKTDRNGHYSTRAMINGNLVEVLVDTGATTVALSYDDANKVRLWPVTMKFDVPVATANGNVNAARVTLKSIKIGTIEIRDVQAIVLPKGALRGTLLGMSFLSRLKGFKIEDGVLLLTD